MPRAPARRAAPSGALPAAAAGRSRKLARPPIALDAARPGLRRAQTAARRALAPGAPASRARLTSRRARPRPGTSPRAQPSRRVALGSTLAAGAPRAPAAPTPPARAAPPAHWSSASYASPRQEGGQRFQRYSASRRGRRTVAPHSQVDRGECGLKGSDDVDVLEQEFLGPQDRGGAFAKVCSGPPALLLHVSERLGFGELLPPHQDSFGLLHQISGLQGVLQIAHLSADGLKLLEADQGYFDDRAQRPRFPGRPQVGHDPNLASLPDEIGSGVGGEQDDRDRLVGEDRLGRLDPIDDGEVLLHDDEIRLESPHEAHGLLTFVDQPHDFMAQAFQLDLQALGHTPLVLDEEDPQSLHGSPSLPRSTWRRFLVRAEDDRAISTHRQRAGRVCPVSHHSNRPARPCRPTFKNYPLQR